MSGDKDNRALSIARTALGVGAAIAAGWFLMWKFPEERDRKNRVLAAVSAAVLQDLSVALKAYETDFGQYPPGPNREMVRALSTRGAKGWPYYEFRREEVAAGEVVDSWGSPLVYESADGSFRIYSPGPNRLDEGGHGDDIPTAER